MMWRQSRWLNLFLLLWLPAACFGQTAGGGSSVASNALNVYAPPCILKWKVLRMMTSMSVFCSILAIALLVVFQMKDVPSTSPLQMLFVGCLGACGALLSAPIGLQHPELSSTAVRDEAAKMFFRATIGALAAAIIVLFLRLRVVDFPSLHSGPAHTTPLAQAALYIFALVSGASARFLFRTRSEASPRSTEAPQKRFAQKGELTLPHIVASASGRD
jgi:hypothetical protein